MPTYIDHVVTEIIPQASTPPDAEQNDQRWQEKMLLQALLKNHTRVQQRLSAEAFDD